MNYNEFGHLRPDRKSLRSAEQIGPKSVITYPSGTQQLPGPGLYEISGLAWSGGGAIKTVEVSTDGGKKWNRAEFKNTPQRMAHVRFGYPWNWDGNETEILSRSTDEIGQRQATARGDRPVVERACGARLPRARARQQRHALENRQGRERDQWPRLGLSRLLLLLGSPAFAQSPTYGVGRTPTAEELRRMDISIGPTGEELPPGRGTAKEGAQLFAQKACIACHGAAGVGGIGARVAIEKRPDVPIWKRERILPLRAPFATTVWDFINRGMPARE